MKKLNIQNISVILFSSFFIFYACRKDLDYIQASSAVGLSLDSILFDTVLTSSYTQTYKLIVFNKENKDIEINKIYLEKGKASLFKINVNGIPKNEVNKVALRKNDSLYIFIQLATTNDLPHQSIYKDKIIIETLSGLQKVPLISFIEKATYHYPPAGQKELLITSDQIWDSISVHVIYGLVKFTNNSKLNILDGTKVYFHENSDLIFGSGSKFNVNGTVLNKVIFRSDKHSPPYDALPNQWNTITLESGSEADIRNAIIIGGKTGLRINEAIANLTNVQIYNQTLRGIFATNATILAKNLVINNCGDASLRIEKGGDYQFYHSTFANYWNLYSDFSPISVVLSNRYTNPLGIIDNKPLSKCMFGNCIIEGNAKNSLYTDKEYDRSLSFNYAFDNNLIKYEENFSDIINNPNFSNTFLNNKSFFKDTSLSINNLRLNIGSEAINKGIAIYTSLVNKSIEGVVRNSPANLGAY